VNRQGIIREFHIVWRVVTLIDDKAKQYRDKAHGQAKDFGTKMKGIKLCFIATVGMMELSSHVVYVL